MFGEGRKEDQSINQPINQPINQWWLCPPGSDPLELVVYGEGRKEDRVQRDEEMASFFLKLGACSSRRRLLDVLSSLMRNKDGPTALLSTVMDTFAYLPPLREVLRREPRHEDLMRLAVPDARGRETEERKLKKKLYAERAGQLPSLQHLTLGAIRGAMGCRLRKVTSLPLPNHMKEYILLDQEIPPEML